jgi:hypothetical protein
MSTLAGRLPVRPHLRPKPRRKVVTADDLEPQFLKMFPNIVEDLNVVCVDAFVGPGCGWDAWIFDFVPLAEALALPVGGEA